MARLSVVSLSAVLLLARIDHVAAQQAPSEGAGAAADTTDSSATAPTSAGEPIDSGTQAVRLRDLEQNVNELKEQVFRSKARLALLAESVLRGVVGGAQARIVHENRVGGSYKVVKVAYALDGAPLMNKADEDGVLGTREQFQIYLGSVAPGEHTLSVELELRGWGHGVFAYLKSYRFKLTSTHTFTATEGKLTSLRAVSYEQGGPTTPFEQRPALHYVESVDKPATPVEVVEGGR